MYFAIHSATLLYHHFKFLCQNWSQKDSNLHQEPNIGSGTFNRISSSLDSQAVKEVPKPIEQVQPNFPTNAQLHFSIFCFLFLKDTYFRELSLKIICYKTVTPW